jgi:hypothetical protein
MFFHVVFQGPEKFWYIFLLGGVIIFQCITTDMFVFHVLKTHFLHFMVLQNVGNINIVQMK